MQPIRSRRFVGRAPRRRPLYAYNIFFIASIMLGLSIQLRKTHCSLGGAPCRVTPFMEVQMQRTSRVWKWMAVVGVLAVGSGIVSAQGGGVSVMTAERSW